MINTVCNGGGVGSGGTVSPAHVPKKAALRDVQNENMGAIHKLKDSLHPGGGQISGDTIKVCGTKRLTPERPSSSQALPHFAYNGTNENVVNARRRFELELGRGRLQNNVEKSSDYSELKNIGQLRQEVAQKTSHMKDNNIHRVPVATSNNQIGPLVPSSFRKHGNSSSSSPIAKVSPGHAHTVDSMCTKDQIRTERFICLQTFLKKCDEANPRDYTNKLLHLSSTELSKYAVELEKRAIQLTVEEGTEMQRKKAMNILTKSYPTNHRLQSPQLLRLNKH